MRTTHFAVVGSSVLALGLGAVATGGVWTQEAAKPVSPSVKRFS